MPVANKEIIKAYFEANSAAKKFCNMPPAFLNLLQKLFNKILAISNYAKLINEAIESFIDPKFLLAVASQALGLVDKENKKEAEEEAKEEAKKEAKEEAKKEAKEEAKKEAKKKIDKAFKSESAHSSIKGS